MGAVDSYSIIGVSDREDMKVVSVIEKLVDFVVAVAQSVKFDLATALTESAVVNFVVEIDVVDFAEVVESVVVVSSIGSVHGAEWGRDKSINEYNLRNNKCKHIMVGNK